MGQFNHLLGLGLALGMKGLQMRNVRRDENKNHQPEPVDPLDLEITNGEYDWDPTMKLVPDRTPPPHCITQLFATLRSSVARILSKPNTLKK